MAYPVGYWAEIRRSTSTRTLTESPSGPFMWLVTSDGLPLEQEFQWRSTSWTAIPNQPEPDNIWSAAVTERVEFRFRKTGEAWIPGTAGIDLNTINWNGGSRYRFYENAVTPPQPTTDNLIHTANINVGTGGYNQPSNIGTIDSAGYNTPGGKAVTIIHCRSVGGNEVNFALSGAANDAADFPSRIVATNGSNSVTLVPQTTSGARRTVTGGIRQDYDRQSGSAIATVFANNANVRVQIYYPGTTSSDYPDNYWAELRRSSSGSSLVEDANGNIVWLVTSDGNPLEQETSLNNGVTWQGVSGDTEEPDNLGQPPSSGVIFRFRKTGKAWLPNDNGVRLNSISWNNGARYRFFDNTAAPIITTNQETFYIASETTPDKPANSVTTGTPPGWLTSEPPPTETKNVYSILRTQTLTGGTVTSAVYADPVKVADKTGTPTPANQYPAGYWAELVRSLSNAQLYENPAGVRVWLRTSDGEPLEQEVSFDGGNTWQAVQHDTGEPDFVASTFSTGLYRFRKAGKPWIPPGGNGIRFDTIVWLGLSTYRLSLPVVITTETQTFYIKSVDEPAIPTNITGVPTGWQAAELTGSDVTQTEGVYSIERTQTLHDGVVNSADYGGIERIARASGSFEISGVVTTGAPILSAKLEEYGPPDLYSMDVDRSVVTEDPLAAAEEGVQIFLEITPRMDLFRTELVVGTNARPLLNQIPEITNNSSLFGNVGEITLTMNNEDGDFSQDMVGQSIRLWGYSFPAKRQLFLGRIIEQQNTANETIFTASDLPL